jgi:hypothetical protein
MDFRCTRREEDSADFAAIRAHASHGLAAKEIDRIAGVLLAALETFQSFPKELQNYRIAGTCYPRTSY